LKKKSEESKSKSNSNSNSNNSTNASNSSTKNLNNESQNEGKSFTLFKDKENSRSASFSSISPQETGSDNFGKFNLTLKSKPQLNRASSFVSREEIPELKSARSLSASGASLSLSSKKPFFRHTSNGNSRNGFENNKKEKDEKSKESTKETKKEESNNKKRKLTSTTSLFELSTSFSTSFSTFIPHATVFESKNKITKLTSNDRLSGPLAGSGLVDLLNRSRSDSS